MNYSDINSRPGNGKKYRVITGLPRSRTFWLSQFFIDSIHEPKDRLSVPKDHIIIDHSFIDKFIDLTDESLIVSVLRDPSDSFKSFKRAKENGELPIGPIPPLSWFQTRYDIIESLPGLKVYFDLLDERLDSIASFLHLRYDLDRHHKLLKERLVRSY